MFGFLWGGGHVSRDVGGSYLPLLNHSADLSLTSRCQFNSATYLLFHPQGSSGLPPLGLCIPHLSLSGLALLLPDLGMGIMWRSLFDVDHGVRGPMV
jgi:hypothetical protein